MSWILLALLAHIANGAVFIVDKSLLKGKGAVGRPVSYALYSAALAGLVVVLVPFARNGFVELLTNYILLMWSLVAAIIHIVALYVFFTAMRAGEPSRVVPITGSAVPLFTIVFATVFLGEIFTLNQGVGIALLVVGGGLLAIRLRSPLPVRGEGKLPRILLPLLAGILFAAYFAITKYIYAHTDGQFLEIFIVTRVMESLVAIVGIAAIVVIPDLIRDPSAKTADGRGFRVVARNDRARGGVLALFISNKFLAAGAFLLQTYVISQGSVSVVNALQGVQYAFVFLLAIMISRFFPNMFQEEIGTRMLMQKIIGILGVSLGIAFLV